jgi:hypothetical protein
VSAYISGSLERGEGTIPRRALKDYRKALAECIKKLKKYRKQRDIMGRRNSYSKTAPARTGGKPLPGFGVTVTF